MFDHPNPPDNSPVGCSSTWMSKFIIFASAIRLGTIWTFLKYRVRIKFWRASSIVCNENGSPERIGTNCSITESNVRTLPKIFILFRYILFVGWILKFISIVRVSSFLVGIGSTFINAYPASPTAPRNADIVSSTKSMLYVSPSDIFITSYKSLSGISWNGLSSVIFPNLYFSPSSIVNVTE